MTFETITRAGLRHLIAEECNDLFALGTSDSGSTTTLVDADELLSSDDDVFIGAYVGMYGGTGAGQELYITDHVGSTGTITFATATDPSNDTTYEIHRRFKLAQYNRAIEAALRVTRLQQRKGFVDESITLTQDKQYDIPDSSTAAIHKLTMIEDTSDDAHEIPVPYSNWDIISGNPPAEIKIMNPVSGYVLRIEGTQYPTVPTADSSNLEVNVAPIVHYAAAQLLRQQRDPAWRDQMSMFEVVMQGLNIGWPANSKLVEVN